MGDVEIRTAAARLAGRGSSLGAVCSKSQRPSISESASPRRSLSVGAPWIKAQAGIGVRIAICVRSCRLIVLSMRILLEPLQR
jgi:hypothetical protein